MFQGFKSENPCLGLKYKCEENTFTNTHVPAIATARATPGT